jgi:hypothetical protein
VQIPLHSSYIATLPEIGIFAGIHLLIRTMLGLDQRHQRGRLAWTINDGHESHSTINKSSTGVDEIREHSGIETLLYYSRGTQAGKRLSLLAGQISSGDEAWCPDDVSVLGNFD